jgi:hypothetical protein
MGLEEWYYSPPLPPYHRIVVDWAAAEPLLMSDHGKSQLINGVEVYRMDVDSPTGEGKAAFVRAMYVPKEKGFGGIVSRERRGGSSSKGVAWAKVIPAELVDAGLLGPGNVMDESGPAECTACLQPIPRRSPTGKCDDREVCKARVADREDRRLAAAWREALKGIDYPSAYQESRVSHEVLMWADAIVKQSLSITGSS